VKHAKQYDLLHSERVKLEATLREERVTQVNQLMLQIQQLEKSNAAHIYKLNQEWHVKETSLLKQIEELTRARDLSLHNESQLKIQITNIENEF
jgi:hypothetical protein